MCSRNKHTDSRDGSDDFSKLELVEDGGFTSSIQSDHKDSYTTHQYNIPCRHNQLLTKMGPGPSGVSQLYCSFPVTNSTRLVLTHLVEVKRLTHLLLAKEALEQSTDG
jgi:hypothetical protein